MDVTQVILYIQNQILTAIVVVNLVILGFFAVRVGYDLLRDMVGR